MQVLKTKSSLPFLKLSITLWFNLVETTWHLDPKGTHSFVEDFIQLMLDRIHIKSSLSVMDFAASIDFNNGSDWVFLEFMSKQQETTSPLKNSKRCLWPKRKRKQAWLVLFVRQKQVWFVSRVPIVCQSKYYLSSKTLLPLLVFFLYFLSHWRWITTPLPNFKPWDGLPFG